MIRSLAAVSVGWLGLSMVADGVPALLVPHQMMTAGRGASELGLVTLLAIAVGAAAQPFAGAWSDRVGRAPIIGLGIVLSCLGLALLLSPEALLPGTIIALLGAGVAQAGYQGLLPDRIAPGWRGRGAGAKGVFDLAGAFVAFAVLAAVLATGQVFVAVVLLTVAMAASLALGLALIPARATLAVAVVTDGSGSAIPLRRRALSQMIAARFLFLLGIYAVGRFLVFFVAQRLDLDADAAGAAAGTLLAALTLATVLAALPAGWLADRIGRGPLMLLGGGVAMLGMALLPLAGSVGAMLVFGTLMAIGTASFGAGNWAVLADLAAGPHSGRLLGLANLGTAGAGAVAGLLGLVIEAGDRVAPGMGYAVAFVLAAVVALAGGVLGWRLTPTTQHSSSAPLEVPG